MSDERRAQALREALEWVNAAFVGDPEDVRSWPILDPLAPHALAVARAADAAEIAEPTARLFNRAWSSVRRQGGLRRRPSRSMRRALAIDEKSYGPDHPEVAIRLNNLAICFKATNRLAEAEPLMRRALAIDETELRPRSSQRGDRPQQSRAAVSGHEPPRRSRAADAPRARDRRKELRPGSSQCGDPPQQSRAAASGHEPPRRGRAADAPRAGDRRKELWPGSSRKWRSASTISRCCSGHEPPRRGRAADAPRAGDRRDRATARIIPMWRATSTISRSCFRPRTASPRPSR